jgi:hypothetical protein
MNPYPVHFEVEAVARFSRVQLLVRLAAMLALGVLGVSIGTVFWVAYLLLPIYAASRIASLDSSEEYLRQDGPRVMRALHWFAAVSAWAGLAVDALPARDPAETVRVALDPVPVKATSVSAILRIFTGFLSVLALSVLGFVGAFVWIWAGITIAVRESVGPGALGYLVGLQRWGLRLLAYQACLVDQYPPFSFPEGSRGTSAGEQRVIAA